jgi:prepilin-type N-terminal cleavage/methylation domain-containing protein
MIISIKSEGFTLIEIVITIVILSILGIFTFSFFSNLTKTYSLMQSQRGVHQEAAYAVERISRELRDAKFIYVSGSAVSFQRAHQAATDSNLYVRYRLSGSDLHRDSASDAGFTLNVIDKIIGRNITAFTPSPAGSPVPQDTVLQITVEVARDGQTQAYSTDVCPKNYTLSGSCVFTGRDFGGCYEDVIY